MCLFAAGEEFWVSQHHDLGVCAIDHTVVDGSPLAGRLCLSQLAHEVIDTFVNLSPVLEEEDLGIRHEKALDLITIPPHFLRGEYAPLASAFKPECGGHTLSIQPQPSCQKIVQLATPILELTRLLQNLLDASFEESFPYRSWRRTRYSLKPSHLRKGFHVLGGDLSNIYESSREVDTFDFAFRVRS